MLYTWLVHVIQMRLILMKGGIEVAETDRITFICDAGLKADAKEVFEKMGLTMTAGLKIYLQAVVREQGIPFRVDVKPSQNTDERMR